MSAWAISCRPVSARLPLLVHAPDDLSLLLVNDLRIDPHQHRKAMSGPRRCLLRRNAFGEQPRYARCPQAIRDLGERRSDLRRCQHGLARPLSYSRVTAREKVVFISTCTCPCRSGEYRPVLALAEAASHAQPPAPNRCLPAVCEPRRHRMRPRGHRYGSTDSLADSYVAHARHSRPKIAPAA